MENMRLHYWTEIRPYPAEYFVCKWCGESRTAINANDVCAKRVAMLSPMGAAERALSSTATAPVIIGKKHDTDKRRVDLLPFAALEQVADILAFGAAKYGENNWRGVSRSRYFAAALRHLFAYARGEENDAESSLPHLAHAACSILFMLDRGDG